jgi:hypothetical protein
MVRQALYDLAAPKGEKGTYDALTGWLQSSVAAYQQFEEPPTPGIPGLRRAFKLARVLTQGGREPRTQDVFTFLLTVWALGGCVGVSQCAGRREKEAVLVEVGGALEELLNVLDPSKLSSTLMQIVVGAVEAYCEVARGVDRHEEAARAIGRCVLLLPWW